MIVVPQETILVLVTALSGILCVAGYLLTFAFGRRLLRSEMRPTTSLGDLLKPLACGMALGVIILFCHLGGDPTDPAAQTPTAPLLGSVLMSVSLLGICAGGLTVRRRRYVSIPAADLVNRLCVAGHTHEDAVARIATRLALAAGFNPAHASDLMAAASLHDIGKTGIAACILNKTGPLDPEERRLLQNHTRIGFRMLAHSREPMLDMAADIALHHHENWDGSGYPAGLSGDRIPLTSRAMAAAEMLDEQLAAGAGDATLREALRARAGTQLDPAMVSLLLADLPGMIAARGISKAVASLSDAATGNPLVTAWLDPARFRPQPARHIVF